MMECPVQCGRNAHAAPDFFLWQELPLKHPERMRSPMPQAAFYGDWGVSPTSRKSLSCHESPACRRVTLARSQHFLFTLKARCAIIPSLTVLKYKIPFKPCVLAALEGIYISF